MTINYVISFVPEIDPAELPLAVLPSLRSCARWSGCDHSTLVKAFKRSNIVRVRQFQFERVDVTPLCEKILLSGENLHSS